MGGNHRLEFPIQRRCNGSSGADGDCFAVVGGRGVGVCAPLPWSPLLIEKFEIRPVLDNAAEGFLGGVFLEGEKLRIMNSSRVLAFLGVVTK